MKHMEQIFLPATVVTVINIIVVIGGILYFRKYGGPNSAQDIIKLMQIRDAEQKETISGYQIKFETLNKELGILQGTVTEQNKKIEEYMSILQGRSPDQVQYQSDMRKFTEGVAIFMDNSNKQQAENTKTQAENTKTLQAISKFMESLNQKSMETREWQKRREKVLPSTG